MANIWDLTGTTVAANYRKVKPSTQLGTRRMRFVKVTVGGGAPDLTTGQGLSDSTFSKLVLAIQNYGEVFMIGNPSSTACVFVMSDDTAQDSDMDENMISVAGTWGQAEANIVERIGGSCTIKDVYLNGGSLSDLPDDTLDGTLASLLGTIAKG